LHSIAKRLTASLAAAALTAACQRAAPPLPPDLSHLPATQRLLPGDQESPEAQLDCTALRREAARNQDLSIKLEEAIATERSSNQAIGYVATVFFPPLWLAARTDAEAKETLNNLQNKQDRINRLIKSKPCQ